MTARVLTTKRGLVLAVVALLVLALVPATASAAGPRVTIAIGAEPKNLDGLISKTAVDAYYYVNWAENLIRQTAEGKNIPGLAESWKISRDGLVVDFMLRRGVKFHNGSPFTAKDVVFSFQRTTDPKFGSSHLARLKLVKSVDVVNDHHVRFTFTQADAMFFSGQGWVWIGSKDYYDAVGEEQFKKQPVGTGPYRFVSRSLGEGVKLEAFPEYWGEKPPIKEVVFRVALEPGTRVAMLKAGEADIITPTPYPAVHEISANPQFKTAKMGSGHPELTVMFDLRTKTEQQGNPFMNRKVRLAVAQAIDVQGILTKVQFGVPKYYWGLSEPEIGFDPGLRPPRHDPQAARKLLAEAGYPNGFDTTLYSAITERVAGFRETAEAIAMNLTQVGIRTKTQHLEYGAYLLKGNYLSGPKDWAGNMMLWTGGIAGMTDPAQAWRLFTMTDQTYSWCSYPAMDALMTQGLAEMNEAKRAAMIAQYVKVVTDDICRVPIMMNTVVVSMKKNVEFSPTEHDWLAVIRARDIRLR
jgi:peptide/nickel transport system substrate-binding protein